MTHRNLVKNELNNQGFETKLTGHKVEVSLTSRKVSQMEIRVALEQIFEGIEFALQSTSDSVLVVV